MNKQSGFTLIELVVVITILGILAATALPRFVNLQGEARRAKLQAAEGAISAAAALVHGKALVRAGQGPLACPAGGTENVTATGGGNVCTERGLTALTFGYPQANVNRNGIVYAAGLAEGNNNAQFQADLVAKGYTVALVGAAVRVRISGATTPGQCQFTDTAPAAAGAAPVISQALTTGC